MPAYDPVDAGRHQGPHRVPAGAQRRTAGARRTGGCPGAGRVRAGEVRDLGRDERPGDHRRPVPRVQAAARRLPARGRRVGRAGRRDRGQDLPCPRCERRTGTPAHRGARGDERPRSRGVTGSQATADLLRDLAPRALGAVVRRYGHFADAEDAVQEALLAAATAWPADGIPDNPLASLIRVAANKMAHLYRRGQARRRREDIAASWSLVPHEPVPTHDDTLTLMLLCCPPELSPGT